MKKFEGTVCGYRHHDVRTVCCGINIFIISLQTAPAGSRRCRNHKRRKKWLTPFLN